MRTFVRNREAKGWEECYVLKITGHKAYRKEIGSQNPIKPGHSNAVVWNLDCGSPGRRDVETEEPPEACRPISSKEMLSRGRQKLGVVITLTPALKS